MDTSDLFSSGVTRSLSDILWEISTWVGSVGLGGRRIDHVIKHHFAQVPLDKLIILNRSFPGRMRADAYLALEEALERSNAVLQFHGVRADVITGGVSLERLLLPDVQDHAAAVVGSPSFEEIDVGDGRPVRCLYSGLWLLKLDGTPAVVLLERSGDYSGHSVMKIEVAVPPGDPGERFATELFEELEQGVRRSRCYRGKILSLEFEDVYSGQSRGIKVHQLHQVARHEVILPDETLSLLDRNVLKFSEQRDRLVELKQSAKKGLLLYGPPGTGKTHTLHYLIHALEEHTTFLIAGEQMGLVEDYMTLARLLAPSIVVLEDVDLISASRDMVGAGDAVLLNTLLNEMDGLREDAPILFLLTTNRPEILEPALAARPGRIDQAVEFKLPDESARRRLVTLYSKGLDISQELTDDMARRTEGASPAFIKELLRKATQFALERDHVPTLTSEDVGDALDEIIHLGGGMSVKLLGGRLGFV